MRDVLMAEVVLNRSCVVAVVSEFVTTGVPQHVGVNGKRYASISAGSRYDLSY